MDVPFVRVFVVVISCSLNIDIDVHMRVYSNRRWFLKVHRV